MNRFNSGRQIKAIAILVFLLIFGAGCYISYKYACVYNWNSSGPNPKILAIGVGIFALGGYLVSLFVYAFGALVDSSIEAECNTRRLLKEQKKLTHMLEDEPVSE